MMLSSFGQVRATMLRQGMRTSSVLIRHNAVAVFKAGLFAFALSDTASL